MCEFTPEAGVAMFGVGCAAGVAMCGAGADEGGDWNGGAEGHDCVAGGKTCDDCVAGGGGDGATGELYREEDAPILGNWTWEAAAMAMAAVNAAAEEAAAMALSIALPGDVAVEEAGDVAVEEAGDVVVESAS
jgi:hypothetical protein